jgi:L-ascorbate metabolism protein UlaG (beta-lactamase superfamily)
MRLLLTAFAALLPLPALAISSCFQLAEAGPPIVNASLAPDEVQITFVGHASFRITTPAGVSAVTDFSGRWGEGGVPDIVTMNKAHGTHWTPNPDPRIAHVLPGWNDDDPFGADHWLEVGDMVVRNVPTDIRRWGAPEPNANSIFIFEVGDLCIGHVGHLHHLPTDEHYGRIGRIDVLMVPVDGGYTMNQEAMAAVVRRLRSRIVIPMHWFGRANLDRFLVEMAGEFDIRQAGGDTVTVSAARLPSEPTVLVLDGR